MPVNQVRSIEAAARSASGRACLYVESTIVHDNDHYDQNPSTAAKTNRKLPAKLIKLENLNMQLRPTLSRVPLENQ